MSEDKKMEKVSSNACNSSDHAEPNHEEKVHKDEGKKDEHIQEQQEMKKEEAPQKRRKTRRSKRGGRNVRKYFDMNRYAEREAMKMMSQVAYFYGKIRASQEQKRLRLLNRSRYTNYK